MKRKHIQEEKGEEGQKSIKLYNVQEASVAVSNEILPSFCQHVWIRSEVRSIPPRGVNLTLAVDRRAPLTPDDAGALVDAGFKVTVESSSDRAFADELYWQAGCEIVPAGSWVSAPLDATIIGLRDFAHNDNSLHFLRHRHIFFSHAFNRQNGWQASLSRFLRGGGILLDYEGLVDDHGRRVASFGEMAGYIGMATAILAWCRQVIAAKSLVSPTASSSGSFDVPEDLVSLDSAHVPLVEQLRNLLKQAPKYPKIVVIGAPGRCGSGACQMGKSLGLDIAEWDRDNTSAGGPFPELLQYDILINAVRLQPNNPIKPFLTQEVIRKEPRHLAVIVDLSCDVNNPQNVLPLYSQCTTFEHPTLRLLPASAKSPALDIVAIPNLPSLLPQLSSARFSKQLHSLLLQAGSKKEYLRRIFQSILPGSSAELVLAYSEGDLEDEGWNSPVWRRCEKTFNQISQSLQPKPRVFARGPGDVIPLTTRQASLHNALKNGTCLLLDTLITEVIWVHGSGAVNHRNLKSSLLGLVRRHELLQTVLKEAKGDKHSQSFLSLTSHLPRTDLLLSFVNLSSEKPVESEEHVIEGLRKVVEDLQSTPLSPSDGVWFRVAVISTHSGSPRWAIAVVFHPLVADNRSAQIFIRELVQAYQTGVFSLKDAGLSFGDYAQWENYLASALDDPTSSRLTPQEISSVFAESSLHVKPLVKNDINYWRKALDDSAPVLQLATDFSRKTEASYKCGVVRHSLTSSLSQQIRDFIQDRNAQSGNNTYSAKWRLYSLFLTALTVILYRRTLESDLVIASRLSGRPRKVLRQLLGPLLNQIALRIPVQEAFSFNEFYDVVNQVIVEAAKHQDVPFEMFLKDLESNGSQRVKKKETKQYHPVSHLFSQVQFYVSDDLLLDADSNPLPDVPQGISLTPFLLDQTTSSMDLSIGVHLTSSNSGGAAETFLLSCDYNNKLFAGDSATEILLQFDYLLQQVIRQPTKGIMTFPLITERAIPLLPNPKQPLDWDWSGPITDCFDIKAQTYPDLTAISFESEKVTYHKLYILTNQLCSALMRSGIKKGDVIGLYGHRSPAIVWAIIGVLKAGAAYCMMDPKYPTDRITQCLDIAQPKGWIQVEVAGDIPLELSKYLDSRGLLFRAVLPPTDSPSAASKFVGCSNEPSGVKIDKEDVAVVTFTSGSTGIPKGVMGRHVSLTHFYPWMSQRFGLNGSDRFSMCSGIAHDPLQRDIFTPLFFGATVHIPTDRDIQEPGALARWMNVHQVTVACLTPAMGQLLTSDENPGFVLEKLRAVFFVGDLLIKRDVIKLRTLAPNVRCINMYGSTETQRAVGYLEITDTEQLQKMKEVIPVGCGMKDAQVLVLNSAGLMAGIGELGELYMRSAHLAKGYIALPSDTRAKFIHNPFRPRKQKPIPMELDEKASSEAEEIIGDDEAESSMPLRVDRFYKTGDLGRYMTTGDVECAGRADDQIKIRGFRIELGEINAFLSKHPYAKENVTIVREDSPGEKVLVSYVVPGEAALKDCGFQGKDGGWEIDTDKLSAIFREHLKKHLPHYMVPTYVVILQSMPLTPNGKINRPGLPKPERKVEEKSDHHQHVLSPIEAKLLPVWSALLPSAPSGGPGLEDNFFDLGGHSLLATQMTVKMREVLEPEHASALSIDMLLEFPTIKSLAHALENKVSKLKSGSQDELDLEREVKTISASLQIDPSVESYRYSAAKAVFLTGGTGFLGAFILAELLNKTEARVYCGVRASNVEAAMRRLKESLVAHRLWNVEFESRIIPLVCDIAEPQFGLEAEKWNQLASNVDVILHNAAYVHWMLPYSKVKATNVLATLEVLKLACKKKIKPVHFVSTTSVFDGPYHQEMKVVYEDDNLPTHKGLHGGYPQSKWVAERVLMAARAKGIPVAIHRPGYITGDTKHGLWNTDDFLCRLIKTCIQLQACPFPTPAQVEQYKKEDKFVAEVEAGHKAEFDMTPVDHVAATIAHIAVQTPENKGYNVINPSPYKAWRVFEKARQMGFEIDFLPYPQWREKLLAAVEAETTKGVVVTALAPVIAQFSEKWIFGLGHPVYDMANVNFATESAGLKFPDLDQAMSSYYYYLIQCKFLSPPTGEASNKLNIDWRLIGEGVTMLTRTNRS